MRHLSVPGLMALAIVLMGCGHEAASDVDSVRTSVTKGAWAIGDKLWQFEIEPSDSEPKVQGIVRILDGKGCKQGRLDLSELKGEIKDRIVGFWSEDQLSNCEGPFAVLDSLPIERSLVEHINLLKTGPELQFPSYLLISDLAESNKALSEIALSSESVLLSGQNPSTIEPVLRGGTFNLKAILISKRDLEGSGRLAFEKLELPVSVRPIFIDQVDAQVARKFNKAVCLDLALTRNNEREVYQKSRERFWTADEHRQVVLSLFEKINKNELISYRNVEGGAACLD